MIGKYAYSISSNSEGSEGEIFISGCKLSPIEVMQLMIENNAKYGCVVYDTKGSKDTEDWDKISYYGPVESDF